MGQPITVVSTWSSRPGVVRFEINRCLTGMGHERYRADNEIVGDTPADDLARRDTEPSQCGGPAADRLEEFTVAQHPPALDHRRMVGTAVGVTGKGVGQIHLFRTGKQGHDKTPR